MNARFSLGFVAILVTPSLSAALGPPAPTSESPTDALARWRHAHGQAWRLEIDPATGFGRFLHGGRAAAPGISSGDADFAASALHFLRATKAMHGIEDATLEADGTVFLPLGIAGSTDKTSVQFRQVVAGVPVVHGFANVLLDQGGALLSVDTTALPSLSASFDTRPSFGPVDAAGRAVEQFDADTGLPPTRIGEPELVIDPVVRSGLRLPVLAWRVDVQATLAESDMEGFTYFVDARQGTIVRREANVHHDVSGNVKSLVSPGDRPDIPSNPEEQQPMRYLQVTSAAGNAVTDANGNFTIVGAVAPISLTVLYQGTFCDVTNAAGGDHSVTALATQSTGNDILMNPNALPTVTAEANSFNWINRLRDWVRFVNPSDPTADFQAAANVNLPGPCNAFWTSAGGGSVNFFIENLCVNSSYSTVVVHEMGHWLNQQYGSGNGGDGFGEGNADVYAMYIVNDPVVGKNFEGNGFIRTGLNNRQFCGDCCGGCYGEVHVDGEPLMGALWKVRARLQTTYGQAQGGLIADHLFNAWMNGYNDGQIKSIIETHWLTLDDNDGNLTNGTPHYADIDGGFRQQGFPGVTIDPCPTPTNYCVGAANSTGNGATAGSAGSTSIAANDLQFLAVGCPPLKNGMFFWGTGEAQVPLGNGFRCIGANFVRFPIVQTNDFGDAMYSVDLNALPSGAVIAIGDERNVQFWYRDPPAGGALFNLTDARRLTFCP